MTNKEIMQSDLLDIIFEHRNKDYGAYALRRDYNNRLGIALGAALSVILFFVLIEMLDKKNTTGSQASSNKEIVEIRTIELPKEKEPEKPKEAEKPNPFERIAQVKYPPIKIVPDKMANTDIVPVEDMTGKKVGLENEEGIPDDGKVKPTLQPVVTPGKGENVEIAKPVDFKPQEMDPEFPGGPEALQRFLATNLNTPEDLNTGEKKMVKVRFRVENNGAVSSFEIVISGGSEFDREVVRVCKKMPRWKPAFQNGVNVSVSYMLPVTFIGVEQ